MNRWISSLGLAAWLSIGWSATARADVVGPPPDDCPSGTTPNSCHGGPFCSPKTCTTNADCTGGAICNEQPFCVTQISCAGQLPPDADPNEFNQPNVVGTCPNGDECKPPGVCEKKKICMLPWEGETSSSSGGTTSGGAVGESGGCSCRVPGVPRELGGAAALGALALAAGVALARRKKG